MTGAAAVRAREGPAAAAAVRRAARRRALRAARAGDRRAPRLAVPRAWRSSTHHPFRVTRNADLDARGGRGRGPAGGHRDASCAGAGARPSRSGSRSTPTMTDEVREPAAAGAGARGRATSTWSTRPARPRRAAGRSTALDRPELKDEPWHAASPSRGSTPRATTPPTCSRVLRGGDVLVHHPYDSFATSVEAFVEQAAARPRRAGHQADAVPHLGARARSSQALIRAAEPGKQVVALVELKARFDEQANIDWARRAGAGGRARRVRRRRAEDARQDLARRPPRSTTASAATATSAPATTTPTTARLYEDVGLLTADPELGADLTDLFNSSPATAASATTASSWSRPSRCASASSS